MAKENKKRKGIKVPHILWIILGLLVLGVILTYVIPSGEFYRDDNGVLDPNRFTYLDNSTPVAPGQALMLIMRGMASQASVMVLVLMMGANVAVLLKIGAIDNILNWAMYKLRDKGKNIIIITLFVLMTYMGGFAGSDALLAMVPIGLVFSKKLKVDPLVALGLTTYPALIGFSTGPSTAWVAQAVMGVQPYSGFFMRLGLMNLFMMIGLIYLFRYINKIDKDPAKSIMYDEGWRPGALEEDENQVIEAVDLNLSSVWTLLIFLGQYAFIVYYSLTDGTDVMAFSVATNLVTTVLMGVVNRMDPDELGNTVAAGVGSMGFVVFIIGLAGAFSLILSEGNVIDTIVYVLTQPLANISKGLANVGVAIMVGIVKIFIPSYTSKVAIVAPIITPIAEALGITGQAAVQAIQVGDRLPNLIHPALGWTVGSLITAKVSYGKWIKWVFPIFLILMILFMIILYILTIMNWTGL